jgi:hypothetical protein
MSENAVAKAHGIRVFSPGVQWYADEILSGVPFTLVRYGEGEWRAVVPKVPRKTFARATERKEFKRIWNNPESGAEAELRKAVLNHHNHPRYWAAMWHFRHLARYHWLPSIKGWQDRNLGKDRVWHDGYVWRRAVEKGEFYPVVEALREQGLPIVVVGSDLLTGLSDRLPIAHHIVIHRWEAYYHMDEIRQAMLAQPPSLFIMCGGGPAKMLANWLFPVIGEQSFMIDFGASWEGLLGFRARRYFDHIPRHVIRQSWEGP